MDGWMDSDPAAESYKSVRENTGEGEVMVVAGGGVWMGKSPLAGFAAGIAEVLRANMQEEVNILYEAKI